MNSSQFHTVPADTRADWEGRYRAKHPDIPTGFYFDLLHDEEERLWLQEHPENPGAWRKDIYASEDGEVFLTWERHRGIWVECDGFTAITLSELLPTFEALVRTAKEVGL